MPQLIINITEEQIKKIINHFDSIDWPITDEDGEDVHSDPPGFGFKIDYFYNCAELSVEKGNKWLNIGDIDTNFWDVIKY